MKKIFVFISLLLSFASSTYADDAFSVDNVTLPKNEAADYWKEFKEIVEIALTVNNSAGNLSNVVNTDVTELRLTGELNGTDINFLRTLINEHSLTSMDLSGARIVEGGEAYTVDGNTHNTENDVFGDDIFRNCQNLSFIILPSTITTIGKMALRGTSITSLTIPASVTSISMKEEDGGIVEECFLLTEINVEEGNPYYYSVDNVVFTEREDLVGEGGKALVLFPPGIEGNYTVPSDVTYICPRAFVSCNKLTGIILQEGLTGIGHTAFWGCSALTSITIPEGVTSIGHRAFVGCDFSTVTVKNSTPVSIEPGVFTCYDNATLYVPAGSKAAYEAADYWKEFKEIKEILPEGSTFTALTEEGVEMTFKVISESEKTCMVGLEEDGVASITETYNGGITIPSVVNGYTVKRIGVSAFYNCSSLTSVNIPSSVTSIGWGAFDRCSGLTSVNIPEGVTIIGGLVFNGCSSLTSINIPSSVTSIGYYAFSYTGLTSITIPSSVTDIDRAFAACQDLTSIIVDINNPVFDSRNNCNAIIETSSNSLIAGCINTVIPETVTSIAGEAFRSQSLMTSISIPASVIRIDDCFSECHNLTSVTVNNPVPFSMAEEAFIDRANITLYVPAGSVELYRLADNWRDFKEIKEIGADVVFTANTPEGVEMTFKVISESDKTCMVGLEEDGVASITETYNGGITIPSVVNGYTVTTIGDFAFCHCESLTSISIPSSVTSIGNKAFTDCSSLTSINIPSSVTSIGNNTFNACSSLTSIVVEEGNERYDSRDNCNAIIETATNKLVRGCLNTVIPNSVTSIGDSAFEGIPGLTSIEIPNRVTCIEGEAFCGTGLTSIDIPSSVTSIGSRAFYHTGLSSITIPSSVENFNGGALTGCTELTSIIVESGNPVYDCRDNCNAIVESSTNTLIAGCKNTIIPNTVTQIGSEAFYDHNEITTIEIPSSVKSIGLVAFRGSGLTSINIPEGVTNIEFWAFMECHDLTSVTVNNPNPISLSDDQDLGFDRYKAVLYVPAGCRDAYANANYWRDFKEVKEIGADVVFTANTPEGVEMTFKVISESEKTCMVGIEEYGVASITETYNGGITIPSVVNGYTVKRIGKWAFSGRGGLTSVTIPETVTSIGTQAFNFTSLTSVTLPNKLESIEDGVFQSCRVLKSITIPSGVTTIGQCPFDDCQKLVSITIPASLTSIQDPFANGCIGLTSIVVEEGNPRYDSRNDCNAVIETATNSLIAGCKNTVIPNTVTSIARHAFVVNSSLTSINIPEGVKSIGYRAFAFCENLSSIIIPSSVTSIDSEVFRGCESLTSVAVMNPVPVTIEEYTFSNRSNATLYVPAGSKAEYEAADYWKDFKEIVEIDTDISQLDNAIYIEPFTARVGEDVRMSINLKNAEAATAYVFDLVLPEGITVATNDKGKYIDELSDRHDDHTRTINYKGENTYSFSTLSGNSEELTGNDGPIRFVALHVDDAMEEGVYPILIKNASYSKPNGNLVALAATKSSVTIEDYVLGDVNGNGGVDIGDAVSIVNYLVGKDSSNFVAKAADTNKNEQIDIGDAVTIVNLLVGKITSLTREFNIIWDEKEPE